MPDEAPSLVAMALHKARLARMKTGMTDTLNHPPGVTVVLLNWNRVENLTRRIIPLYMAMDLVAEILVVNNNPADKGKICSGDKVQVIEATRDLGLDSRFAAALMARTEAVLIQDDDLALPRHTLAALYQAWLADGERLHGCFGRRPTEENRYAYLADQVNAFVPIVLTRVLLTGRALVALFFSAREHRAIKSARAEHARFGTNPENGEDIVFSYAVARRYGKKHRIHALDVMELPTGSETLSKELRPFWEHRTEIMRAAQQLAAEAPDEERKAKEPLLS